MIGRLPAALAFRWPVRGAHKTDGEGRFMVEQTPGETTLYAYCPVRDLPVSPLCLSGLNRRTCSSRGQGRHRPRRRLRR